ncbi:F-box protein [Pyrus ussuriensis x Pyrus communis]|uniref:F-box protein n=1 Tax=Pyrus ussuriensis x Pyrus communis TaxID=2448454 RepID=A0A5N5IBP9_9ROSA|nr:F-box protein [Pyrus ussuriensis x Pyrus communis]
MPLWSTLPHDLIASVAKRLFTFEDFIAFGAVCKSWKSAATKENFTTRHQIPLLMLPEKKEKESTTTTATSTVREFYNLKNFYAVDPYGTILVCEIEDPMQARTRVIVPKLPTELGFPFLCEKEYLVESPGALLLVTRSFVPTVEFRVFEVPLSNGDWSDGAEVKSLGTRTLFLGYNSSFSVESSNYGCKANCIY